MSWRVVAAVVAVALVNVAIGLEWQNAQRTAARDTNVQTSAAPPPPPKPFAEMPSVAATTGAQPGEANAARAQAITAPPGCNVAACEARYKSFRISDCTYQPNDGPRRLCRRK